MEAYYEDPPELSALSILSLFETTKAQRKSFVMDVINRLENSEIDPLKAHLQLKAMANVIEQFTNKKDYPETAKVWSNAVLEAAQKEGKSFELYGSKISVRETGVDYDYTKCEDVEWNFLNRKFLDLKKKKEEREKFLQTIPAKGQIVTDEATGETWTCYPPAKSSTTAVVVNLK